jgi:hypothetical protein
MQRELVSVGCVSLVVSDRFHLLFSRLPHDYFISFLLLNYSRQQVVSLLFSSNAQVFTSQERGRNEN